MEGLKLRLWVVALAALTLVFTGCATNNEGDAGDGCAEACGDGCAEACGDGCASGCGGGDAMGKAEDEQKLGWTTWLRTRPPSGPVDETVFRIDEGNR